MKIDFHAELCDFCGVMGCRKFGFAKPTQSQKGKKFNMNLNERLLQLNNAIEQIESGAQEYSIGSRRVKKADLSLLYKERDRLQMQINEQNGFDGCFVADYFSR